MYDILQPNILSRIVPLLSDTLTKKKSLYYLFIEKTKTIHARWGERRDVTNQEGDHPLTRLASNIVHRVTRKCSNSIWISIMID